MPIIIEDLETEITPEHEAATPGPQAEAAAAPGLATQQQWLALRDLTLEREARLAVD